MTNTAPARPARIVLAYSGDLDTALAIPWLVERHRAEVVALTLDFGQGRDLEHVRDRALALGAVRAHVLDVREEFARDYLLRALRAGALFHDGRRLAAALGHSAIAAKLVEVAAIEQTEMVAHGGATNANRIGAAVRSIQSGFRVIAPGCEWGSDRGRLLAYAREHRWPLPPAPATAPPKPVGDAAHEPAAVDISFDAGAPVAVNGIEMTLLDLIGSLDFLAGKNGIGRRDRFETPAASVLAAAHDDLQQMAATAEAVGFSRAVGRQYGDVVESGGWFTVLRRALDAFVDKAQEPVNGVVRVRLFQGVCEIVETRVRIETTEDAEDAEVQP
jgi:argininosuccinate synthase